MTNRFVIYITEPYGGIQKILGTCPDRDQAMMFCSIMNELAETAVQKTELSDLLMFATSGGMVLSASDIFSVKYGGEFNYKSIPNVGDWDYSFFNSTFLGDWDHYTSDFERIDIIEDGELDYDFDYATGTYDYMQLSGQLRSKLVKFNKAQSYKKYDKTMTNPENINKNPLKIWHRHTGFKKERNHIIRMIDKEVKVCQGREALIKKIKSNVKYQKCAIYRSAASCYIETLENFDESWWDYMLPGLTLVDNTVWRKTRMFRFLGYGYREQKCFIDGRIRTRLVEIEL